MAQKNLVHITILIMLFTVLGTVTGFVIQILTAHYFGVSKDLDAFIAVSTLPFLFYGLTNSSFMTALVHILTKNKIDTDSEFSEAGSNILTFIFFVSMIVSAIVFVKAEFFSKILVPGFSAEQLTTTTLMMKILSISIFFLGMSSVTTGLLYFKNHFSTPTLVRPFLGLATIICLVFLQRNYSVYTLAIGMALGSFFVFFSQITTLLFRDFNYKPSNVFQEPLLKDLFYASWPLLISSILYYSNKIITNTFASHLPQGSISVLNYAFTIASFPTLLFTGAIATAIFPHLNKKAIDAQTKQFKQTFITSIRWTLLTLIPITIVFVILNKQIITILFERGRFDALATTRTATALAYYSIGLIALGLYPLITNALVALGEIKKSMWLMFWLMVINTIFNFLFISGATNGLALASSFAYWIAFCIGILMLKKRIAHVNIKNLIKITSKIVLALLPVTLFLITTKMFILDIYSLLIIVSTSATLYFVFCHLLHVQEISLIKEEVIKSHHTLLSKIMCFR